MVREDGTGTLITVIPLRLGGIHAAIGCGQDQRQKGEVACAVRIRDGHVIPLRLGGIHAAIGCGQDQREKGEVACAVRIRGRPIRVAPPDVFLVDLRRLAALFGDVSEKAMSCAFVARMPENGWLAHEGFELSQILARAQAIITDERPVDTTDTCLSARRAGPGPQAVPPELRCYT
ncbi:hypothetical protein T11_644 [Trichinella zimbabwensis]|uniref:Uncharacterized protein n=1 Tax=Trichinella zimbabwensis TaxID=268475 RepID=A0A0V1I8L6_9BILA|nr:hypothetical protein T11_644 [Trichinella zimbabwensis]